MTEIQKGTNDLVAELSILVRSSDDGSPVVMDCDSEMARVRVTKFYYFGITFFTGDIDSGITCSYENGSYNGIDKGEQFDFAILNDAELATLSNGALRYRIHIKMLSDKFEGGKYDYSEINNTDLYLTDNKKENDNWSKC